MAKLKEIIAGATLGTVAGSLAVFFFPKIKDRTNGLTEKAIACAESLIKNKHVHHNGSDQMAGGLIGLILGAGTALLLTPKTGKQLRTQLSKNYHGIVEKKDDIVHILKKKAASIQERTSTKSPSKRSRKIPVKKKKTNRGI